MSSGRSRSLAFRAFRDLGLFAGGCFIFFWEVTSTYPRPVLLLLAGAMIGLPLALRGDESRQSGSASGRRASGGRAAAVHPAYDRYREQYVVKGDLRWLEAMLLHAEPSAADCWSSVCRTGHLNRERMALKYRQINTEKTWK